MLSMHRAREVFKALEGFGHEFATEQVDILARLNNGRVVRIVAGRTRCTT